MDKAPKPKYDVLSDFKSIHVQIGLLFYIAFTILLWILIWNIWAAIGFSLAAYAVIGNDAVQTLMTYIHSNKDIPWKYLYSWVAIILLSVLWYGYFINNGDITYGRIFAKGYADINIEWYIPIFPLILVFLTRFRWLPVSTSLLMLSIFSTSSLFWEIVIKSAAGYAIAFVSAFIIWLSAESILKKLKIEDEDEKNRKSVFWRIAQTSTTILLFGTWLMHDMVNIAVFLPAEVNIEIMLVISILFLLGLAYTFYINGWPVGNIVTWKTSTNHIIAATMVDLVYFIILIIFKEWSNIPMSTTWVFVWLLAWRQFGIRFINRIDIIEWPGRMNVAYKEAWKDFSKIMTGLGISVFALLIVRYMTGT